MATVMGWLVGLTKPLSTWGALCWVLGYPDDSTDWQKSWPCRPTEIVARLSRVGTWNVVSRGEPRNPSLVGVGRCVGAPVLGSWHPVV